MTYIKNNRMRRPAAAVLTIMALGLGACVSDPAVTRSVGETYRERHAVVVAEGSETLDIVPGGGPGGLTERQREDIRGFARVWRNEGRGLVAIQLPRGGATDMAASHTARTVRTELVAGGIPSRAITTSSYQASHPSQLAPMRITFPRLTAEVASQCGQWPDNLGSSLTRSGRNNDAYANFGCATQQNFAAMIADPEDIIRPRAETPSSGVRRVTTIDKYYKGEATAATAGQAQAVGTTE
jgi:pilus assembly protein CpaD